MESNFGASAPYTVGIEEEFQLVDPASLALVPAIDEVLAARDSAGLPVASELLASFLETRSPVYGTVANLATELPGLRRRVGEVVAGCGARLAAAGTHPFSDSLAQEITPQERYLKVEEEMGWTARMQAIYGLHVHVAVPDEESAIRAVAALSQCVPLFIALSANSPFWAGIDTRLSSVRAKVFGLVPRSGLPPLFLCWEDFEGYVDAMVRAGSIPDYSWCWWDARPHPKLGTVELRAPDAQTEADYAVSLAALAQCIVATADQYNLQDPLLTEENKWRAIRYGLEARFHDFSAGQSVAARDAVQQLVKELRPRSQDLGCEAELEGVLEILYKGNGADKQRAIFERRGSLRDVVAAYLVDATG